MKTGDCEKEKWIVFVKIAFLLLIIAECGLLAWGGWKLWNFIAVKFGINFDRFGAFLLLFLFFIAALISASGSDNKRRIVLYP